MQCKELEAVVEQQGLGPLPEAARAHAAGCSQCRALIADFSTILSVAKEIPGEMEPPARVWLGLCAQLEREGLIREPAGEPSSWWRGWYEFIGGRMLATATVGLLIVAAAVFQIRNDTLHLPADTSSSRLAASALQPFAATRTALSDQEPLAKDMILASSSPVDASLRDNLEKLDDFIGDCERHLSEQPQDDLAREYLSNAYQQKAELLATMMDRGGSVN